MYYPDSAATNSALIREANAFLARRTPTTARGFYFTQQDLHDHRIEQHIQRDIDEEELQLQHTAAAAAQSGGGQQQPQPQQRPPPPSSSSSPLSLSAPAPPAAVESTSVDIFRPGRDERLHFGSPVPSTSPSSAPPSSSSPRTSGSPPPPPSSASPSGDVAASAAAAASGDGVPPPPPLLQQQSSEVQVDLDSISDPRVREVVDPNSRVSMHQLSSWSDAELDGLVEAFAPEYIPGLIRKAIAFEGGQAAQSLSWDGLTYTNDKGVELLKHVSGYLQPGQIVAILAGPDGGATPLLNILAGREKAKAWTGEVLYNGRPRSSDFNRFTGYVDKDDTHIALLTVYETLYFSARLRLPAAIPDNLVRFRVKVVMKLLGLSHVADSIVGDQAVRGISGGEKRRVSFGVDMVAGRECLLADLPTNGLDSATAYALIRTMRFTCKAGTSMMCSIVQPSPELFRLFHRIIVLSKGAVLYFGPPALAERFIADSGFMRPSYKSLPQFLEELSSAPEKFYVHRFNKEVMEKRANGEQQHSGGQQEQGEGQVDRDTGGLAGRKEFGVGKDKNEQGDAKEDDGDRRGAGAEVKGESKSGHGKEVGLVEGGDRSFDEGKEVQRPNVSNNRVQCWNLLVDRYEGSAFKKDCRDTINKAKEQGDGQHREHQQHQQQQQQQQRQPVTRGGGGGGDHEDEAYATKRPQQSAGAGAAKSGGGRGQGQGQGDAQKDGGSEGYLVRSDHGVMNFWYRRWNAGPMRQFWENLKRMSLIFLRTVGLWRNTWLRGLFIAFVLGSLFYDLHASATDIRNRVGLIFYVSLYIGFGGVQLFPVLSAQRPVYYAQLSAGYYQGFSYYVALQLVQLPILIIEVTLLLVPIWGLSNLSGGDFISNQFWFAWLVLLITSLISRAWVMVLLALSPVEAMANVLLVMTNILFITLCGFLIPVNDIEAGWKWFHYISYISYTFRALIINDVAPLFNDCVVGAPGCQYQSGLDALQMQFQVDGTLNKWKDFGRLCGIFIAFSLGAAVLYVTLNWDKPDSPESPEWGEDDGERKERIGIADGGDQQDDAGNAQQRQLQKAQQQQPSRLQRMKSKIVRSVGHVGGNDDRVTAQQANAVPGDAPNTTAGGSSGGGGPAAQSRGGGEAKGSGGLLLAQQPMLSRDDNIPMPIPPAALQVAKARKSNSSPALMQKEQLKQEREERKKEAEQHGGAAGDGYGGQSDQGGKEEQKAKKAAGSKAPLQRAASHDFGFDVEHMQTEALVSGNKSYLQWKDLSYTVTLDNGTQRRLLHKTFGYVRPGKMCALMGASGAGKSTLLDVLAGKKTSGAVEGEILVNGREKDASFTRIAGYVEQSDSINPMSTVREAIAFSGRMRLPQRFSNAEVELKVKNVLQVLGLAHLADELVGSPGMGGVTAEVRKKVTIGVELVAEPSILFLDEPTTGLDSAGAYAVMSAIHTLSKHMAVVCTVHQPSTELTKMFDDILLLKEGGEVVYFGEMSRVVTYFAEQQLGECPPGKNPVDFALEQLKRCNEKSNQGKKHRDQDEQESKQKKEQQQGGLLHQLSRRFSGRNDAQPQQQQQHDQQQQPQREQSSGDVRGEEDRQLRQQLSPRRRAELDETRKEDGEHKEHSEERSNEDREGSGSDDDKAGEHRGVKAKGEDADKDGKGKDGKGKDRFEDLSPERAARLPDMFVESPYYEGVKKTLDAGVMPEDEKKAYKPPDLKSSHAAFPTQVAWLSSRFFTNVYRNKFGVVIRFVLIFVFTFFIGTIFFRLGYNQEWATQRLGVLFLVLINVMFSANAFLPEIYFNRPIYFREITGQLYSPEAYFVARYIGDAPYVLGECLLYSTIYWWVGLNPYDHSSHYGFFFWILLVLRYCGIAITHFFGTAIAAPDFAATLEITFFNVMLAFTGFLIPGPDIPSWWVWLYDVSFIRYALDTAVYFEFIHETFDCDPSQAVSVYAPYTGGCDIISTGTFDGQQVVSKCQYSCGYDIFTSFGVDPASSMVVQNFGILHAFAIFFFFIAYLALRFINHVKR